MLKKSNSNLPMKYPSTLPTRTIPIIPTPLPMEHKDYKPFKIPSTMSMDSTTTLPMSPTIALPMNPTIKQSITCPSIPYMNPISNQSLTCPSIPHMNPTSNQSITCPSSPHMNTTSSQYITCPNSHHMNPGTLAMDLTLPNSHTSNLPIISDNSTIIPHLDKGRHH